MRTAVFLPPAAITFGIVVGFMVVLVLIAPKFGKSRAQYFRLGLLLGVVAFIPSCFGVMKVLDRYRYGIFHFSDREAVSDSIVKSWLPNHATDIVVDSYAAGFRAKFAISKQDLEEWFNDYWDENGEFSSVDREQAQDYFVDYGPDVDELGWPSLTEPVRYEGPMTDSGTDFTIWFSEVDRTAYEEVGYW